jgi:hypothetical protein
MEGCDGIHNLNKLMRNMELDFEKQCHHCRDNCDFCNTLIIKSSYECINGIDHFFPHGCDECDILMCCNCQKKKRTQFFECGVCRSEWCSSCDSTCTCMR